MSQSDVLARAKQGDFRAISVLLNSCVQTEGVSIRVTQRDACLYVLLEAANVLDLQSMVAAIERQVADLLLSTVSTLMIFGRKTGERKALWQRTIELDRLTSHTPLPSTPETPLHAPVAMEHSTPAESMPTTSFFRTSLSEAPLSEASLAAIAAELMSSPGSASESTRTSYDTNHDRQVLLPEIPLETAATPAEETYCLPDAEAEPPNPDTTSEGMLAALATSLLAPESAALTDPLPESVLSELPMLEPVSQEPVSQEPVLSESILEVDPIASDAPLSPEPMTAIDASSVPDPWDADVQRSAFAQSSSGAVPSSATSPEPATTSPDESPPSKSPSVQDVADALRGVTTVDTTSLLQRPEAIVLLAWLSILVVWQLYLALAIADEIPGDQPLSGRKLAQRLGVHPRTLARRRHRPDFDQWSQDLDPDSISWAYRGDGRYAPLGQ